MNPQFTYYFLFWLAGGAVAVIASVFIVRVLTKIGFGEDEDVGISIYVLLCSFGLGIYTALTILTLNWNPLPV